MKEKRKLFNLHPYCYWCKQRLYYPSAGGKLLSHAATLDHIYTKRDERRKSNDKVVLCCYLCNNRRGETRPEIWGNNRVVIRKKVATRITIFSPTQHDKCNKKYYLKKSSDD